MSSCIDKILTSKEDPTRLFDLLEELAVGSYGHVYKAIYKPTGEVVALKIIGLEEDDTFEEMAVEISILDKCQGDPNIVKYFGSWKREDKECDELFIAMELCDGGSANDLYQVLERPLKEEQIAYITYESLKALAYLHDKGIIHRDIKAANILLTESGAVKLTDFGVSAEMSSPKDKRRTFIGTPYWIAPEVVNTVIAPYGPKCDVWSLGITCIEMAELQPPLHDIAPMTAVMQIPKNPPPKLKNSKLWSNEFRDFLAECFIKNPDERKSARELLDHPWFAKVRGQKGECLVDLIRMTKEAEAAYISAAQEDDLNSGDTVDFDSPTSSPGISPAASPAGSLKKSGTPPPPLSPPPPLTPPPQRNGTRKEGADSEPKPRAPGDVPSFQLSDSSDTVIINNNSSAGSPGQYRSSMSNKEKDENRLDVQNWSGSSSVPSSPAASPATSSSGLAQGKTREELHAERKEKKHAVQAQRPQTLTRTLKKSNAPGAIVKKKLLRMQLRQMKKLMKTHEQQTERQTKAHQDQVDQLQKTHQLAMSTKHKKLQQNYKKLLKDQQTFMEEMLRNHGLEVKQMQRQHAVDKRKAQKDVKDDQKKSSKDFKTDMKAKEAAYAVERKKMKKSGSNRSKANDLKQFDNEHKSEVTFMSLVFQHRLNLEEMKKEHSVNRIQQRQIMQKMREQLGEEVNHATKHFLDTLEIKMHVLKKQHAMEVEMQQAEMEMEQRLQTEAQALQREQVAAHHKLMAEQLARQVQEEERIGTREFKEGQKQEVREWLKQQKQKSKSPSFSKKQKMKDRQDFKKKQQLDEVQFLEEALRRRQNVERELLSQQAEQLAFLTEQQTTAQATLREEQAERVVYLQTKHRRQLNLLIQKQWDERMTKLEEHHSRQQNLLQTQQEECMQAEREMQRLEKSRQKEQHDALEDFIRNNLPNIRPDSEVCKFTKEMRTEEEQALDQEHQEHMGKLEEEFAQLSKFLNSTQKEGFYFFSLFLYSFFLGCCLTISFLPL
ncbi:Mitogen-activated protein kinase kinase kinase kinase 1 [Balamuthia mandrillaris]